MKRREFLVGGLATLLGYDIAQAQTTKTASIKLNGIEQKLKDPDALYTDVYKYWSKLKVGLTESGYNDIYGNFDSIGNEAWIDYLKTKNPEYLAVQISADMFAAWTEKTAASKGRNIAEHLKRAENKYRRALSSRTKLKKYDPAGVIFSTSSKIKVADEGYIRENLGETLRALAPYVKK